MKKMMRTGEILVARNKKAKRKGVSVAMRLCFFFGF
jgi:hypothetical protein